MTVGGNIRGETQIITDCYRGLYRAGRFCQGDGFQRPSHGARVPGKLHPYVGSAEEQGKVSAQARDAGPVVEAKDISVVYEGQRVLQAPSSAGFSQSQVLPIIGPNGSGKTTFFLALPCFWSSSSGTILYGGTGPGRRIHVRPAPQNCNGLPGASAAEWHGMGQRYPWSAVAQGPG